MLRGRSGLPAHRICTAQKRESWGEVSDASPLDYILGREIREANAKRDSAIST